MKTIALIALMALAPAAMSAQGDVIKGRITGSDSLPVVNAQVTVVAISSAVSKPAKTDKNGVFTVLFPEGEGDYFVTVIAIGYSSRRYQIKRMGDEDVLNADVRLQKQGTVRLNAVRVRGRPPPNRVDATGGGDLTGNELTMALSALDLNMMSDPNALAMLLPGATFIPGADGDLGSFSIYGLDPDQNVFMLNGLNVGPDGLPRDAGISSSIAGSPYDGTRGGFSGGQISSRMAAGTNIIRRNLSLQGYTPRMQLSDRTTQSLGNQPTYGSFGGGFSGPIKYNTLFYNVGIQYNDNSRAQRTLLDADVLGLTTAGLSPDSIGRLLGIQSAFGLPLTVSAFPDRSTNRSGNLAANISLSPPVASAGSFSLTLTGNWGETRPMGSSLYSMPSYAGSSSRSSGSAGLNHQVMIRNAFYSVTTVGWSVNNSWSRPFLSLPSATVRLASVLDDGSTAIHPVRLGGNPSLASSTSSSNVQLYNATTWMSTSGTHSFRLGTQLGRQTYRQDASSNLLGSFSFNSIEDFENGVASGFTRLLTPRLLFRSQAQLGVAINDQWRPNPDLQMSWSLRMDASRFGSGPERNPLVEQTFGVRNDRVPSPVAFSPRVSFSKFLGDAPQISAFMGGMRAPRARISGGFGVFQGIPSAALVGQVVNNTGLPSAIQTLSCQGAAAPFADWRAYLLDPSFVPEQCADGTVNTVFSSALPNVTLIDPAYNASRSARGDLTWRGPVLRNRFSAAVMVAYALNVNQAQTVDLNFDPTVRFTLADEANRPVFVQPTSISAASGVVASRDARVSPLFNRVNELRSDLRSDSKLLNINLVPLGYNPRYGYSLTYSLQLNRRQVPGSQSTVGNPLDHQWGLNDFGQTHRFALTLSTNIRNTVRLAYTMMATSGVPVTPRVVGDINGDGYSNDRAFVYDPATTADPALAQAMQSLLASGSPIARKCLAQQLGQLASLGKCRGPWTFQGANQLGISINPLKIRMPQRASIQLAVGNPLRGLDILLHGTNKIHGWGQTIAPDQNLLFVRGFDPSTNRFRYDVNQRFGSTRPQQSLSIAAPVTFTALVRLDIAPTRERQDLTHLLDRGRRNRDPLAPEELIRATYLSGGVPNPIAVMLRQADQLRLTERQADSLAVLDRWFTIRLDSIWTPIARALAALPDDYNRDEAYAMYKRGRIASFDLMIKMAPLVKAMLSPAQHRLLPAFTAMQLDVNYLETIRASTSGYSTAPGAFSIGGGGRGFGPGGMP